MAYDVSHLLTVGHAKMIYDYMDEKKASVNGTYEDMMVGSAEQLISTVGSQEGTPYVMRKSGGLITPNDRKQEQIIGGTIAWNQLVGNGRGDSTTGWTPTRGSVSSEDDALVLTIDETDAAVLSCTVAGVVGHTYFIGFDVSVSNTGVRVIATLDSASVQYNRFVYQYLSEANTWTRIQSIFTPTERPAGNLRLAGQRSASGQTISFRNIIVIDLTRALGPEIASYIQTLDTTEPGSGVAWVAKLFPNRYYSAEAGKLCGVKPVAQVTNGLNQWDENWELGTINNTTGVNETSTTHIRTAGYIPVIPGQIYYFRGQDETGLTNYGCRFYDQNKNFLESYARSSDGTKKIPDGVRYMRVVFLNINTYTRGICINLHSPNDKNGTYEPYEEHIYSFAPDMELNGIPMLDESNKFSYAGDVYSSEGVLTRRYGSIDLGSLTWTYQSSYFRSQIPDKAYGLANLVCSKYARSSATGVSGMVSGEILGDASAAYIYVKDSSYSSASAFTAAVTGVKLVYEFGAGVLENVEGYTNPQIIDRYGTERFVDWGVESEERDVEIPVGHDTIYQMNLRTKIEVSPDTPITNGDYILRHADGRNTYVADNSSSRLDELEERQTPVIVSGTTPAVEAQPNRQYVCGEVTSLSFTPSSSGICDIIFESGDTPTVLTVPNTVLWPKWFDPSSLEADTAYELNVQAGVYGMVTTWEIS